jgi:hypothetical protein
MLFIVLGVLAALFIAAAVIDIKARRRGIRYRGVDASSSRNNRNSVDAAEAQMRARMHNEGTGNTGGMPF